MSAARRPYKNDDDKLLDEAHEARRLRDFQSAAAIFTTLQKKGSYAGLLGLARCEMELGRNQKAIELLEPHYESLIRKKANKNKHTRFGIRVSQEGQLFETLAIAYSNLGQSEKAIQILSNIETKDNCVALHLLASLKYSAGDYQDISEILILCDRVERSTPYYINTRLLRARIYIHNEEYHEALYVLKSIIEHQEKYARFHSEKKAITHLLISICYKELDEKAYWQEAFTHVIAATTVCPTYAAGWSSLAKLYEMAKDYKKRDDCYALAKQCNPVRFNALHRELKILELIKDKSSYYQSKENDNGEEADDKKITPPKVRPIEKAHPWKKLPVAKPAQSNRRWEKLPADKERKIPDLEAYPPLTRPTQAPASMQGMTKTAQRKLRKAAVAAAVVAEINLAVAPIAAADLDFSIPELPNLVETPGNALKQAFLHLAVTLFGKCKRGKVQESPQLLPEAPKP